MILPDPQHAGKDNVYEEASSRNSVSTIRADSISDLVCSGFGSDDSGDSSWNEEGVAGKLPSHHGMRSSAVGILTQFSEWRRIIIIRHS